jgi:ABC-type nitrate/sulfonate/bicarbonate transport system substrate-binding protein
MSIFRAGRRSRGARLAVVTVLAGLLLAACGSDDESADQTTPVGASATSAPVPDATEPEAAEPGASGPATTEPASDGTLDKVTIALDFFPSVYFSGIYAAIEEGYFEDEGIEVEILPYAFTPAETLIDAGQADLAISYPPDVVINRANGLEYKAVAGLVNENTTALVVLADSEYQSPADLDGLLYGGFGVASDPPLVSAILAGDGVAEPTFEQIVLSTDAVTALQAGEVDYTAVFGGVGDIISSQQGIDLRLFPYRDYLGDAGNYPNSVTSSPVRSPPLPRATSWPRRTRRRPVRFSSRPTRPNSVRARRSSG